MSIVSRLAGALLHIRRDEVDDDFTPTLNLALEQREDDAELERAFILLDWYVRELLPTFVEPTLPKNATLLRMIEPIVDVPTAQAAKDHIGRVPWAPYPDQETQPVTDAFAASARAIVQSTAYAIPGIIGPTLYEGTGAEARLYEVHNAVFDTLESIAFHTAHLWIRVGEAANAKFQPLVVKLQCSLIDLISNRLLTTKD